MSRKSRVQENSSSALEVLLNLPLRGKNPYVLDWKRSGGKVFGYVCSYVPEEILYAENGRILPIRIGAAGCKSTEKADVYLPRCICSFARSVLQLGMIGEYEFLDGFVFMNGCDQLRSVYNIWKQTVKTPFLGMLSVPKSNEDEGWFAWYLDEIRKLRDEIATKYFYTPDRKGLKESIRQYNRYRELMKELYGLRAQQRPLLSGVEAMGITNAAFSMPKEAFNTKLEAALEELRQRPGISDYRARIMVGGSFMDDGFLIGLIESMGGVVVTDNLCFGRRHIEGYVEEDGDSLEAIAKRYFYHNPCPRMMGSYPRRLAFTKRVAEEGNVDGIIFETIPFCDNQGTEVQMESEDLRKQGIPTLILEREYIPADAGRLKTRIQAFFEKIGR